MELPKVGYLAACMPGVVGRMFTFGVVGREARAIPFAPPEGSVPSLLWLVGAAEASVLYLLTNERFENEGERRAGRRGER